MSTSPSLVFVDTNIIAYARDRRDVRKQTVALGWLAALAKNRQGRISTQVLIEYYATASHPKRLALPTADARADVAALTAWNPISPTIDLLQRAWQIQDGYSASWWDAMIIAAALLSRCSTLLSEDLQDGLVVDQTLTVLNPFTTTAPPPPT